MSDKFKLAQKRNWSKYRLMGSNFPSEGLTEQERERIIQIRHILKDIMINWDDNSRTLGLFPRKKREDVSL
jgi:hypothetical protein